MALWFLPMIASAVGKTNQSGGSNSAGAIISSLSNLKKQEQKTDA